MPRRLAHLDTLDHLGRIHAETGAPVHAERLAETTGRSVKTIANHVVKLNAEDLIVAHGDSTYEPTPHPDPIASSLSSVTDVPTMTTDETERRAATLDAEAERLRTRRKALTADNRAATMRHEGASLSYMEGTGATAEDVQHAAGLVEATNTAVQGIDARLAEIEAQACTLVHEIKRTQHIAAAARAAQRAESARRDFLDRTAAAHPEIVRIGHRILEASDAFRDACADFYKHGTAAGLPPIEDAEVTVMSRSDSGVVSARVVPAQGVQDVLGYILDRLSEDLSHEEAATALAAAQEGHRLGDAPLTRDLHHTPLWTRMPATQPPGGESARLLVRSLIDLAREAGDGDASSQT